MEQLCSINKTSAQIQKVCRSKLGFAEVDAGLIILNQWECPFSFGSVLFVFFSFIKVVIFFALLAQYHSPDASCDRSEDEQNEYQPNIDGHEFSSAHLVAKFLHSILYICRRFVNFITRNDTSGLGKAPETPC